MPRKAVPERVPLIEPSSRDHVGDGSIELLTEAKATARVKVFDGCKNPVRQFREWACRVGVPVKRIGRRRVYDPGAGGVH